VSPYAAPYQQPNSPAQRELPGLPRTPARPAIQAAQLPGAENPGVLPAPTQPQRVMPGPRSGAMVPISGNQGLRSSGVSSRVGSSPYIKQEGGNKRKVSEIQPEVIDLTLDD
jgi:hypothetical protein